MASTTTSTGTSAAGDAAHRPEGNWTLVAWTTKRSDIPTLQQRMARTILGSFAPTCATGPCDLVLSPAGRDGTYREAEIPQPEGAAPNKAAMRLTWKDGSYVASTPARATTCTLAGGKVIPGGYTEAVGLTLRFVPAAAGLPARLVGTSVSTARATATGKSQGCTDFVETETIGGAQTGSLDAATLPGGAYDASIHVITVTPRALAPAGTPLWLGAMNVAGSGATTKVTGLSRTEATVSPSPTGWSAAPSTGPATCAGTGGTAIAKGADGTEKFAQMHAVALTEAGKPIFVGGWTYALAPNATGAKAGCVTTSYEGRILLVPAATAP